MAYEKQFWEEAYNNSGEEDRLEKELSKYKIAQSGNLAKLDELNHGLNDILAITTSNASPQEKIDAINDLFRRNITWAMKVKSKIGFK